MAVWQLPTWAECEQIGELDRSPLEDFIYHETPAGKDEAVFRDRLWKAIVDGKDRIDAFLAHPLTVAKPFHHPFHLPIIDEDIVETLDGTDLIVKNVNNRWEWTQEAVDFACILNRAASASKDCCSKCDSEICICGLGSEPAGSEPKTSVETEVESNNSPQGETRASSTGEPDDKSPAPIQDGYLNPINQVFFRAGLIACREYMARFVERESPTIANSIRQNWWPSLGQDFGPPRKIAWNELTEGEYGEAAFRVKTVEEVSPTIEALPVALAFLECPAPKTGEKP